MGDKEFSNYAFFIAEAASQPLYDLKVEEYAHILMMEAEGWNKLPITLKEREKDLATDAKDWALFFSGVPDLTDVDFVLRCRKWVLSYLILAQRNGGI